MKHIKSLMVIVFCLIFVGQAYGILTTIGTAIYDSDGNGFTEDYKLIYDNDSPFGSIVWLDFTSMNNTSSNQMSWAVMALPFLFVLKIFNNDQSRKVQYCRCL